MNGTAPFPMTISACMRLCVFEIVFGWGWERERGRKRNLIVSFHFISNHGTNFVKSTAKGWDLQWTDGHGVLNLQFARYHLVWLDMNGLRKFFPASNKFFGVDEDARNDIAVERNGWKIYWKCEKNLWKMNGSVIPRWVDNGIWMNRER